MNVGILLSVREKATRLPGKVLLPFGKYNVTEHILRGLLTSVHTNKVILSTSTCDRDEVLVKIAEELEIDYFKGSEDDKLIRYRDTAHRFGLDFVVIVDGDDPFCSVEHIDKMIEYVRKNSVDFVTWEGLPLGATAFGVKVTALERICQEKEIENTEVWQHLFAENISYKTVRLKENNSLYNKPDIRMTLDYKEDYSFFKAVYESLMKNNSDLSFENIMKYLEKNPQLISINKGVQEQYEAHLLNSKNNQ